MVGIVAQVSRLRSDQVGHYVVATSLPMVVLLACSYGLWTRQSWARRLALVIYALATLVSVQTLALGLVPLGLVGLLAFGTATGYLAGRWGRRYFESQ